MRPVAHYDSHRIADGSARGLSSSSTARTSGVHQATSALHPPAQDLTKVLGRVFTNALEGMETDVSASPGPLSNRTAGGTFQ